MKPIGAFDLGRLSRLHRACFDDAWSRSDIAHLLALPGGFGLIARFHEGGFAGLEGLRGIGFAIGRVVRDEAELLSLGVIPAYRHRGVARELLQATISHASRYGALTVFLEVAIDNAPALALYRSHGFERVGTRPDYYQRPGGMRMAAHTMRLDVGSLSNPSGGGEVRPI